MVVRFISTLLNPIGVANRITPMLHSSINSGSSPPEEVPLEALQEGHVWRVQIVDARNLPTEAKTGGKLYILS